MFNYWKNKYCKAMLEADYTYGKYDGKLAMLRDVNEMLSKELEQTKIDRGAFSTKCYTMSCSIKKLLDDTIK